MSASSASAAVARNCSNSSAACPTCGSPLSAIRTRPTSTAAAKEHADATKYTDLRKLLEDRDIDAVAIATCNHWHALAAIWACQAGKDVYVEKPLAHNHWEGQQVVNAARKHDRIVQVGTQQRSDPLKAS